MQKGSERREKSWVLCYLTVGTVLQPIVTFHRQRPIILGRKLGHDVLGGRIAGPRLSELRRKRMQVAALCHAVFVILDQFRHFLAYVLYRF